MVRPARVLTVVVQRDDQQWFDNRPGIIRLDDDDSAFADSNKIRMPNGDPPAVSQANVEWLERLPMQSFTNAF